MRRNIKLIKGVKLLKSSGRKLHMRSFLMSNSTRTLLHMCFRQKAPLHLSLSHSGEQGEGGGGRGGGWREYLSSLLRFVRASGISKLLLYTDLLQRDRRESRQSVSLAFCTDPLAVPPSASVAGLRQPAEHAPSARYLKYFSGFHLHPHLCPCCVMSMALLAGTGEPPSVTLSTSMDFLSGLLLP